MTVFNYFARKQDLMLDRSDDLLLLPFASRSASGPGGKLPSLRSVISSSSCASRSTPSLASTLARSTGGESSRRARRSKRLHELEDEAADGLALELAGPKPDGLARLMAVTLVLTVRSAREEAVRVLERGGTAKKANAAFHELIERGFAAVQHMLELG